jgi:hypothetical protein
MFDDLLIGSVPLVLVVFGLVEFIKSLGVAGRALTVSSMSIGLILGFSYQLATKGMPAGIPGWIESAVFGLALGLVASGLYDFANARFPKANNFLK